MACLRGRNAASASEIRQSGDHAPERDQAGDEGYRLDRVPGHGTRADTRGDHRDFQEYVGPQAGHHSGQNGREGGAHDGGQGHERQPGVHQWKTDWRGFSGAEPVLAGRHLRHHAHRTDAGDQRQRPIPSGRGAHAGEGSGAERAGRWRGRHLGGHLGRPRGQRLGRRFGRHLGQPGMAGADRFAPGVFGNQRRHAARLQLPLPADGPAHGAGLGRRADARQQAGGGMGARAESGRERGHRPGGWRYGGQRLRHVTYNDGKRVLAFGHPLFNLGPVDMPLAKSEVVLTLASQFQPSKMPNATEIVGALRQDRHSGIMGELGATSPMIPVTLKVRSLDAKEAVLSEKDFHFNVFVHQKWTPTLMMLTLYNSISNLNDFADETTYRLNGKVEMNGPRNIGLATMQATGDMPMPAPMALAVWLGDKFNRLYLNNVNTPDVKGVNLSLDLLPERRGPAIEPGGVANPEVQAGDDLPVKVSVRPYRGEAIQREVIVKIPAGLAKGDHRILLSDADTLNRMQNAAGFQNRFIDVPQAVSLLNQERTNNRLYVSLVKASPTAYYDDKTMPSMPPSVLNGIQVRRGRNPAMLSTPETASEQTSIPFDYMVTGSYSLRIHVK